MLVRFLAPSGAQGVTMSVCLSDGLFVMFPGGGGVAILIPGANTKVCPRQISFQHNFLCNI